MEFIGSVIDFLSASIILGSLELPFSWLRLAGAVLLLGVFFVVYRLLLLATRKILGRTKASEKVQKNVIRWVRIGLRVLYLVGFFSLVGWLFGARMLEYLGRFFSVLGEPLISSGSTSISFFTLLLTVPVFYLASWAGKMSRSFLDRSILDRVGLDESRKFSISSLVRYGVMVVVVLIGLSVIGIDLSALAVLFGVLGLGIGFGLQNTVSNFFSGLVIILTRPIKEGDRILVNNYDATVVHIRLLSTVINTVTEETIIIPNSLLVNNTVHNYSYDSRRIYLQNTVSVAYDSDLEQVIAVLDGVGRDNPFGVGDREPTVRVVSFDDSGIAMNLLTLIRDVSDKFKAHSWANLEIWRRFKAEGISIPFPQVDLHVKGNQNLIVNQEPKDE
ncbi:MAG: mechanosensitive ion channel [Spirochaetales bacterium]|jgi:potassium-dependent mechanosensitive channel|nr:mechanosensitive ion channel [Spirochaetales bacterium]